MYVPNYLRYNGGRIFFENLRRSIENTNNVMSYRATAVNFRQARPLHQHACIRVILSSNPPCTFIKEFRVSYTYFKKSECPAENIFSQCEMKVNE